ncbi:uncharacterized protein O3C94_020085 [Discoglossus pictus]
MSHSVSHSSSGSHMGSSHIGGHYPKIVSHGSSVQHGGSHKVHHSSPHMSHHGDHYRAPSIHGGSGISFSKHSSLTHGCGVGSVHGGSGHGNHFASHSSWKNNGMLNINEKETMQLLNDRLSSYMEKVRSLEQENAELEKKICERYSHTVPSSCPDFSHYFKTIEELQTKINSATVDNARIVLQIDNARLAAEDFRNKYEAELRLRTSVEEDVRGLRRILEELNIERQDLEMQVQCLQEELLQLKKVHEEEVCALRAQMGARVNVEVNAAPSVDLNKSLAEIREQYENLMERNMREVESMFQQRSAELNREVSSDAEQLSAARNELIDLKRCVQTLEIELQAQLRMKSALECSLAETQASYASQLGQLQGVIDNVEAQLTQTRAELERQMYEYKILMDQKTHLEMEIATYKRLLEGHDIHMPAQHPSGPKEDHCLGMVKELAYLNEAIKLTSSSNSSINMSHSVKHATSGPMMGSVGSVHISGHYPKPSSHVPSSHHGGSHKSHHRSSSNSSHGGHYKTPSVHGSSESKVSCFPKHSSSSYGCGVGSLHSSYSHGDHSFGGHNGWKSAGMLNINEKETMQLLNDRLSNYLEKVRSLEQENSQLERKICEWYENNSPKILPDNSQYFRTIEELQNQVFSSTVENAKVILQIDNANLAADDFKSKYEMEMRLRNNVEEDVRGLRRALEELNMERQDLAMQVQCLQEELLQLKKNHEEEVNSLRAQLGARVNVEMNAAPSVDLNRALSEIREQYENLMERNMREVENMFQQRTADLNRDVSSGAEQLQSVNNELIDLKRCVQTLEIDLQSQLSMKSNLECSLAETQASYASQLGQLQGIIDNVESQLAQIRGDLERQNHEYRILMDQKTHLEMEIATYKRLLEGHDIHVQAHHSTGSKDGPHHTVC